MSGALESFLRAVQNSPDLQDQIEKSDLNGVLELADTLGFKIRPADILKAQARQILELDDDSLDRLASGGINDLMNISEFNSYMSRI